MASQRAGFVLQPCLLGTFTTLPGTRGFSAFAKRNAQVHLHRYRVQKIRPSRDHPRASLEDVRVELDHVALSCSDPLGTAKWYSEFFGFEEIDFEEFRNGLTPFPSVRISAGTIIDFFKLPVGTETLANNMSHLCFAVKGRDELDAMIKRLSEAGYPPENPVPLERSGARGVGFSFYTQDNAGNVVEVRTYSKP